MTPSGVTRHRVRDCNAPTRWRWEASHQRPYDVLLVERCSYDGRVVRVLPFSPIADAVTIPTAEDENWEAWGGI